MASGLRLTVLCLAAGLWFAASALGQESGTCPAGWTPFKDNCYLFCRSPMYWANAERHCTSVGGNLASIHSAKEYIFLWDEARRLAGRKTAVWLGGNDSARNGVWLWSDGSDFNFQFWNHREPNNKGGHEDCMLLNYKGWYYANDYRCDRKIRFFCKKKL